MTVMPQPPRALVAALLATALALGVAGCARPAVPAAAPEDQVATLERHDVVVGQGTEATTGSKVTVHYSGWLYDDVAVDHKGKPFDSSRDGGMPFRFVIGKGQVIAGWDQGVAGMRAGGQRRLVIPSSLAYGDAGAGGVIPPKATLVFDVELLHVDAPR